MNINVAKDYSVTPGGRYETEGLFSGEKFMKELLLPRYQEALKKKEKLIIVLDGTYGYATSFLEEAFGGLARALKNNRVLNNIELISEEDLTLGDEIKKYVKEALVE